MRYRPVHRVGVRRNQHATQCTGLTPPHTQKFRHPRRRSSRCHDRGSLGRQTRSVRSTLVVSCESDPDGCTAHCQPATNRENSEHPMSELVFASTSALEQELDGSEETFRRYFFALYHCSPDEKNDLNARRESARQQYPTKAVEVGRRFVLVGEAAFQIVSAYYQALALHGNPDAFREYAGRHHDAILRKHRSSQSLPVPIDLTEGQLSADLDLEFYACLALSNGQVFPRGSR